MLRGTLIAAISLAALAPSSAALADDVCMSLPRLVLRAPRLAQSVDVGPHFSSDGASLISRGLASHGLISQADLSGLLTGGEVERPDGTPLDQFLWCWSANDPRCSPKTPAPDECLRGLRSGNGAVATGELDRWPALEEGGRPPRHASLGGPREGVSARVERPPRG